MLASLLVLPFRDDLLPYCPVDGSAMWRVPESSDHEYLCPKQGCGVRWKRQSGYYSEDLGIYIANLEKWLKVAVTIEHGYFYIGLAEGGRKIWFCSVKDCPHTLTE